MSGSSGVGGEGGDSVDVCAPQPLPPRRIVRLTSSQVVSSVAALVGEERARGVVEPEEMPPLAQRSFPPLADGPFVSESHFAFVDRVGERVGQAMLDDFATLTDCGETPSDACGQAFVTSFAERAYRRPLADPERESLLTVYSEAKAAGGSVQEAVQHGVWAVLDSPYFLYRTEFGDGDARAAEVSLTSYELASQLSYFLTDGPPDGELLGAATNDELGSADVLGAQAQRLLESPAARSNFVAAMLSLFRIASVPHVVLDPESVPGIEVTSGLLGAIFREGELFFERTLFDGSLRDLLTSRRAWVNAELAAPIYGVPAPVNELDADGFGLVELPAERAGLLTAAPFLTSGSRPDGPSVVGRGLTVNAALLCQQNPPFPEGDPDIIDDIADQAGWSERQKADYRLTEAACRDCHEQFDAFGLALDVFDSVGRYRATDPEGRPIDPAVTLPKLLDAQRVSGPAEMASAIADSDVWKACLAMNYADFALADPTRGTAMAPTPAAPAEGCEVRDIVTAFEAVGEASFPALVVEIVRSRLLRVRSGDGP